MRALTTTITGIDAWGREHTARIAWKPLKVTTHSGRHGTRLMWASEDDPPACFDRTVFGHVELDTIRPIDISNAWRLVVRPERVEDGTFPDDLRPGQWTLQSE